MKLAATVLATLLSIGGASLAHAGSRVDVSVIDRSTGEQLQVYRHRGRLYVAGVPGNRYAVSLHNKTGSRVLAVVSVDGVNAVSGQTAAAGQSGYVLSPWQSTEVAGWRKSMDEVAAFYFTNIEDSYAARTDRPQHVGVIGVAVFNEAELPRPSLSGIEAERSRRADHAGPAAAAPARSEDLAKQAESSLGTGHGERIDAPTRYTDFRRASSTPAEVITVYYNSRANLLAQGVIGGAPLYARPNPFPGGFVPDPRY